MNNGKSWAACAMLASVLLLGGCIRFGPQADEMEQTANRQSEQENTADTAVSGESESGEAPESENAGEAEVSAEEEEAAQSAEESEAAASLQNDPDQDAENQDNLIEVSVTRTDSERMVRFDLQMLPSGYSLSGMTWEPDTPVEETLPGGLDLQEENADTGVTADEEYSAQEDAGPVDPSQTERVTATYQDAVAAGQTGRNGFFVDMDGQRIGYRYSPDQAGRSGRIRLDFRDGEGGTAAWEARITLGIADIEVPETEEESE